MESHKLIEIQVNERINSIKDEKFELSFSTDQISFAISQLNTGKAFGFDCVTADMTTKLPQVTFTSYCLGSTQIYLTMVSYQQTLMCEW